MNKIQKEIRRKVIERDGLICTYCKKVLPEHGVTMDHVIPKSKNGAFSIENLVVSCMQCNSKKGNFL